jgi:hypothetical protein
METFALTRRDDRFRAHARDRARLDSLVEASLAEQWDDRSSPRSFGAEPRRIMEDEFEGWEAPDFGSPLQSPRKVNPKFVSCRSPSAAIKAITGATPVASIQAANTRAIKLLDNVINELQFTRKKIVDGAPAAWPTASDHLAQALQDRFGLDAGDRSIWTGTGARSVLTLIKRFRGARQILADGWMKYTCVGGASFPLGKCAPGSCTPTPGFIRHALSCRGNSRIVLCEPWWRNDLDGQAATLLHEALHIYFPIGDTGVFANAHVYEQFVLDLN